MLWLKRNWIAVLVVVAVFASFVVSNSESASRDRAQAAQLVKGCQRTSTRTAFNAVGQFELSERVSARGNPGDAESALRYAAVGNGLLFTIPVGDGVQQGDKRLAEAVLMRTGVVPKYVLTATARKLQHDGCVKAYR